MKTYQLPSLHLVHQENTILSQAQYTIAFQTPSCPGGTCNGEFTYQVGDTAQICFGNNDAPTVGSEALINCEGTDQTFTLVIASLNELPPTSECNTNATPFQVVFESPDLNQNCVLTHFLTGDQDQCTRSCNQ